MENENYALELRHITKTFGSVVANKDVSLELRKGEIISILGENGSGKTTLMNMISGIYKPDTGEIFVNGNRVVINSPIDAFKLRIGMIHQHFKLVDVFDATENVLLGLSKQDFKDLKVTAQEKLAEKEEKLNKKNSAYNREKIKDYARYARRAGFNRKGAEEKILNLANKYGFEIDPTKKVYDMSVSEKQTLEIVKVLYRGVDTLILDEPTAVLTPQEIKKLFKVLREMKASGKSIIIITHKLNEVMEISDRVAILRKGEHVATIDTKDADQKTLAEMMVGHTVSLDINRTKPVNPEDRLILKDVCVKNREGVEVLKSVSLTARSGEILGIAGVSGSGQKELLETISGLNKLSSGDIIFHNPKENKPATFFHKDLKLIKKLIKQNKFHYPDGTPVVYEGLNGRKIKELVRNEQILFNEDEIVDLKDKNPLEIRELGIRLSFIPEDRLGMGLVGGMNLIDNTMLRSYRHGHWIFLNRKKPKDLVEHIIKDLNVVTPSSETVVSKLSGGNVQKVLLGREIALAPKVLMAAYPVRGLDINSSYLIYNLLDQQKQKGIAVIYVGEDLDVLLALCDKVAVICNGKINGVYDAKDLTKEKVGLLMTNTEGAK